MMLCQKKELTFSFITICILFFWTMVTFAESVTVSWDANSENDLSGYKIYYGTSSKSYDDVVDVGNSASFVLSGLEAGKTYFFAVTAYDFSGNESGFSTEVSTTISSNATPPALTGVTVSNDSQINILFTKPLDKASAENSANYSINNGVQVVSAVLDANLTSVQLTTSQHESGKDYVVTISNVSDTEGNSIAGGTTHTYNMPASSGGDTTSPLLVSVDVQGKSQIDINFSEPIDKTSAEKLSNYSISPSIQIIVAVLDENLTRVRLITTDHRDGITYTLNVNNVLDRAENPNKIAQNSAYSYQYEATDQRNGTGPIPNTFTLYPNFPNPFNPETSISFFLDKRREVELKVYNPLGQLVKTLVNGNLAEGNHRLIWDGTNNDSVPVPSGTYIYSLEVKRNVQKGGLLVDVSLERRVRKMTLLR